MILKFKIGPIVLSMEAEKSPSEWPIPYIGHFVYTGDAPVDLSIRILFAAPPERGPCRLLGELPNSWRLYDHENHLRFEILDQLHFQLKQAALFSPDWSQITLYQVPSSESPVGVWAVNEIMEPLVQWWLTARFALQRKGVILHGSAASLGDQGLAFVGPSGAGKSTIVRWSRDVGGAVNLNDERILVWNDGRAWQVSGTPWPGELCEASALTVPLTRLCVLSHAPLNRFSLKPLSWLWRRVLPEAFLPLWSPDAMGRLIQVVSKLLQDVPSGELEFRNDASVVDFLRAEEPSAAMIP